MPEATDLMLVYVPVPSEAAGRALAEGAVCRKLAACGNILPGITSIYEWNGKMETASEALLLLKTTRARAEELEAFVWEYHPYECPCVLCFGPDQANSDFAEWVRRQTASD
ncbi:MAG: divalent-cation tolerance protein CutA [Verrucomicrobia bacterium]|nr:divalent-cation tolerance protein CutA [Verrucomicrobiota bacterium]MCH8526271.1 divalent-cation tolerance protein CutA [Kiritimatiellia bacterium]